jgi:hypothetical protein
MSVNSRGDRLNTNNRIIDKKSDQIKRQQKKQTSSTQIPTATSNASLKREKELAEMKVDVNDTFEDLIDDNETPEQQSEYSQSSLELKGGLAAAIAKAKTVQQEKITPPKQASKAAPGVRKL